MSSHRPISVVVPTRNSAATLESCLRSILSWLPEDGSHVVVVDGDSTDTTVALTALPRVSVLRVGAGFVARSRNLGAARSGNPLLAFVDSDCTVGDGWYRAVQDTLNALDVGVVGGRYMLRPTPTWVEAAWDRAHRRLPGPILEDTVYVPGGNLAMRREVFDQIGGFDERVETGEDMDLCARVQQSGFRVVDHAGMTCVHLGEPHTLLAVYRRNCWHGRGARLRYSDGRLAPVLLSTIAFVASLVIALAATVSALASGPTAASAVAVSPVVVPVVYAWHYAKAPRLAHTVQLTLIYFAYFCGRGRALPTVLARILRDRSPRN